MLVGRRVASVATNFCGMHDANIFYLSNNAITHLVTFSKSFFLLTELMQESIM